MNSCAGKSKNMPATGRSIHGPAIPRNWNITPEWMTQVVAARHPGAKVSAVKRIGGSDGTSSRALFELQYSEGRGPKTLFAKTKGNALRRFFQWATENAFIEGRLVESGACLPLEHPVFYYGAVDYLRLNDMIIMENVIERGAVLNDATRPLTVATVAQGLEGLATLHSRYWRFSKATDPQLGWVRPWTASRSFKALVKLGCTRGIPRLREQLPDDVAALGPEGMVNMWTRQMDSGNSAAATLLHGDAHVGNTYTLPDGDLGFFDWGVVRKGHWSYDVGYFIISALDENDRRHFAQDLVECYRKALDVPRDDRMSSADAWLRFRSSPPYGLAIWVTTGAEDQYQRPEICTRLAARFASAFVDLNTPEALARLGS